MKYNYRHDARTALERARKELDSKDDERLKYAALEFRMVVEAITYDAPNPTKTSCRLKNAKRRYANTTPVNTAA